jgi:23S rRNA (cytidine1920-2'-O)/16S rRNA (cytidine1409-2'-O)-methyltransferase
VVRDAALRVEAVRAVADAAAGLGWGARAVTTSALPGPSGNLEYFLWLRKAAAALDEADLAHAIATGPQ